MPTKAPRRNHVRASLARRLSRYLGAHGIETYDVREPSDDADGRIQVSPAIHVHVGRGFAIACLTMTPGVIRWGETRYNALAVRDDVRALKDEIRRDLF